MHASEREKMHKQLKHTDNPRYQDKFVMVVY
jgi:hypothetical protein